MRARVRVGEISRRSTGATVSGLIGKSRLSSWSEPGCRLSPACSSSSFSGSMVIESVSTVAEAAIGAGDDLALRQQAFDAGVDQAVAELVEIENAGDQHDERGEVEEQDAPGQAGEDVHGRGCARQRHGQRASDAAASTPPRRRPPAFVARAAIHRLLPSSRHVAAHPGPSGARHQALRGTVADAIQAFRSCRSRRRPP